MLSCTCKKQQAHIERRTKMRNYVPDMTERFPEGDRYESEYDGPIEYDPRAEEASCDIYGFCDGSKCKFFAKCHLPERR